MLPWAQTYDQFSEKLLNHMLMPGYVKCNRDLCIVRYTMALFVTLLSVLLLIGVAVDRFLSVVYPLKYNGIMRFSIAKYVIQVQAGHTAP